MAELDIRRLDSADTAFGQTLAQLTEWSAVADAELEGTVQGMIAEVRSRGDEALVEYTNRFDNNPLEGGLEVSRELCQQAAQAVDSNVRSALQQAAERIRAFHEQQKQSSWEYRDDSGTLLGQQVTPLSRVGVYVPGGRAAYPSSVLMNVIPARVAGVEEVIMVVPAPGGELSNAVLCAAEVAGVDRIFTVGGAQAVAALAYGTQSIPQVDKIVGPGNRFVACAKKQVFGDVGLDMVAGPSEILVVCDGKTDPDWIAMDLFSQAEHDEDAQALLISPDAQFLDSVAASMQRLLPSLPRNEIIAESLRRRGAFIKVGSLDEAIELVNVVAPEHLELSLDNPSDWAAKVRNAGAIFLGRHTPESMGDYCAGPNHVLPTSTTARFASPLGVYDFQKRTSLIGCSAESASELGQLASTLAHSESLQAHARAAEMRIAGGGGNSDAAERQE